MLHAGGGAGGERLDAFFDHWVVNGLALGAAAACVLRGLTTTEERTAWLLMGLGIALWTAGSLWYYLVLADLETVPVPSVADALWVGTYPAMYAALVLLVRNRMSGYDRSLWLDGAIGALALTAVATTLVLEPLMHAAAGSFALVATGLAYVAVDLILLILVATVFALSGWGLGRGWMLVGLGLCCSPRQTSFIFSRPRRAPTSRAACSTRPGPRLSSSSALPPGTPRSRGQRTAAGVLPAVAPAPGAITAVALLAYDHFARIPTAAMALASVTLVIASVRLFLGFLENRDLLRTSQDHTLQDPLTGIGNRRLLMRDMEQAIAQARPEAPLALVLIDLNEFKYYNDTFGHLAGDQLLTRLVLQLEQAVLPQGAAYRLGGDEFCVLIRPGDDDILKRCRGRSRALRGG